MIKSAQYTDIILPPLAGPSLSNPLSRTMPLANAVAVTSWPASSPAISRCKAGTNKPRFLVDLEAHLERGLIQCGESDAKRLQLFSEVLTRFIDDFSTYKPFMSTIKAEYERQISNFKAELQEIRPLFAEFSVKDRCQDMVRGQLRQIWKDSRGAARWGLDKLITVEQPELASYS